MRTGYWLERWWEPTFRKKRTQLWEKERRLMEVKKKERKCLEKLEAGNKMKERGSKKAWVNKKDGNVKEAGKREGESKTMWDVLDLWRQKSPLVPKTPATAAGNSTFQRCNYTTSRERCTGYDIPGNLVTDRDTARKSIHDDGTRSICSLSGRKMRTPLRKDAGRSPSRIHCTERVDGRWW